MELGILTRMDAPDVARCRLPIPVEAELSEPLVSLPGHDGLSS
jgi:hypothetical protein